MTLKNLTEELLSKEDVFLLELGTKLPCAIEELKRTLTAEQIEIVGELSAQGMVHLKWNDDIPHENFQELAFTILGNLVVFKIKYSLELATFKTTLKNSGYKCDAQLIDDFLVTSDLTLSAEEILTAERIEHFSNVYDRYIGK